MRFSHDSRHLIYDNLTQGLFGNGRGLSLTMFGLCFTRSLYYFFINTPYVAASAYWTLPWTFLTGFLGMQSTQISKFSVSEITLLPNLEQVRIMYQNGEVHEPFIRDLYATQSVGDGIFRFTYTHMGAKFNRRVSIKNQTIAAQNPELVYAVLHPRVHRI